MRASDSSFSNSSRNSSKVSIIWSFMASEVAAGGFSWRISFAAFLSLPKSSAIILFAAEAHQAFGEGAAFTQHTDMELALAPQLALYFFFHIVDGTVDALGIVTRVDGRLAGAHDAYFREPHVSSMARSARIASELHFDTRGVLETREEFLERDDALVEIIAHRRRHLVVGRFDPYIHEFLLCDPFILSHQFRLFDNVTFHRFQDVCFRSARLKRQLDIERVEAEEGAMLARLILSRRTRPRVLALSCTIGACSTDASGLRYLRHSASWRRRDIEKRPVVE